MSLNYGTGFQPILTKKPNKTMRTQKKIKEAIASAAKLHQHNLNEHERIGAALAHGEQLAEELQDELKRSQVVPMITTADFVDRYIAFYLKANLQRHPNKTEIARALEVAECFGLVTEV